MIRLVLVAVWAALVAAGASYGATYWKMQQGRPAGEGQEFVGLEYKKTRALTVPVITNGAVQGYIIAQFVYTADSKVLKHLSVPPEYFLLDEAFRALFSNDKIDFRHLDRFDVGALTKSLATRMRERLDADIVKDVLIQEFNFVPKDEVKK